MPAIFLPRHTDWTEVGPALQRCMPLGSQLVPTGKNYKVVAGDIEIVVRVRQVQAGTKVKSWIRYPWWMWLFIGLGLIGFIVIILLQVVHDGKAKPVRDGVHACLLQSLWSPSVAATVRA